MHACRAFTPAPAPALPPPSPSPPLPISPFEASLPLQAPQLKKRDRDAPHLPTLVVFALGWTSSGHGVLGRCSYAHHDAADPVARGRSSLTPLRSVLERLPDSTRPAREGETTPPSGQSPTIGSCLSRRPAAGAQSTMEDKPAVPVRWATIGSNFIVDAFIEGGKKVKRSSGPLALA